MGANLAWEGIVVTNPGHPSVIADSSGSSTLTLGSGFGISMNGVISGSAASQPLIIDTAIALANTGSSTEFWHVGVQPLTIGFAGDSPARVLNITNANLTVDVTGTTVINNILTGSGSFDVYG